MPTQPSQKEQCTQHTPLYTHVPPTHPHTHAELHGKRLTCVDLGSRNGTYVLTTQDTNQLNAQAEYQIPTNPSACTFLRLGATDIAICGPDASLLQVYIIG